MARKLDILVPVYNEPMEVIKPLLDSILVQQNVDLENDIGVIVCCDGGTFEMTDEFLKPYPFAIEYHMCEHKGVSATRNACLDHSTADYVAFCDCDDAYCSSFGMWTVLNDIKENGDFNTMVSVFMEESRHPDDRSKIAYIPHEMDSTFVHGKIHRRQYLLDQNIRWNDKLTVHEDSYFNILCQNLTEEVRFCPLPFYLWRWRDQSVCRHDPDYILKTYNNMLDSNDALIDEFVRRMREDKANFYVAFMVYDAYYLMNKPEWIKQENQHYREDVEKRFSRYFKKHKSQWEAVPAQDRMMISNGVRQRSVMEGMMMEAITLDDWLKKIEKLTRTSAKKAASAKPEK